MKITELAVLLPCHSLEDFPIYHELEEADQLLTAWSALWHPALMAAAESIPTWHRVDVLPEVLEGRVLTVPPFVTDRLPGGWIARAESEGARVISETVRSNAVNAALAALGDDRTQVDSNLVADFLALGFCKLQIELLTRQMRYSTYLDETYFQQETLAAAQASVRQENAIARDHLQHCFDALYEARKHFYPADFYLLDITLTAESLPAGSLVCELADSRPTNLLATTSVLKQIASDPAAWSALLAAIDRGAVAVLGGEPAELELPLVPAETALASLREGVLCYESLLGRKPRVFGRRRAGLSPLLPQMLTKLGYHGALHFTLDDGRFPVASQAKTRWEGVDGSIIDVFGHVPCDATRSETFLGLSRKIADSMDNDHVAGLALAHWPSPANPWYDDLKRIAALSPVLGKFMSFDDYFSETDMPGRLSKFEPDQYRTPYLKQAVIRRERDPISRFVVAHRDQSVRATCEAIDTLNSLISGKASAPSEADVTNGLSHTAALLPRKPEPAEPHYLVVNPLTFARKIGIELPPDGSRHDAAGAAAAPSAQARNFAIVDVPAMGFAWATASGPIATARAKPIAADNVLRNEFFEATVSRGTGGIQSLFSFTTRGNQLSQQIAMRLPSAPTAGTATWQAVEPEPVYTKMKADSVETTIASAALGEIVSRGALLDADGNRVAGFRQTTRLWAGSRVLHLDIELFDVGELRADPWNSYIAARFARPDDLTELWRGVGLTRQSTEASRLEAPEFIEIGNGSGGVTILTGGLPYHRRSQERVMDSLLVVRGETMRHFTLGIGVELPNAGAAAQELIAPTAFLLDTGGPPTVASGWFFHIGAKNVVATHWAPLLDDASAEENQEIRRVKGFRARLLETTGRAGRVTLRAFRGVAAARQVDYLGQTLLEVTVDDDKILLDFAAYEWIELEAIWN